MSIQTYSLPPYFAVKFPETNSTCRFYKWNGTKVTCCVPPTGEKVFEESIARRIHRIGNNSYGFDNSVRATRIGYIQYANNKYPLFLYDSDVLSGFTFKKRANLIGLTHDHGFDYTAIQQKIAALGPWPVAISEVATPVAISQVATPPAISEAVPPVRARPNVSTKALPLPPAYVCDLLIENAITKNETCPIIYEPLTKETSVVTSCFHVFNREAFRDWRKKSKECPACRTVCLVRS
jgi:hypothetical protein